MAINECPNGHIYDTKQYSSCPYCKGAGSSNRVEFRFKGAEDVKKEVPAPAKPAEISEKKADLSDTGKTVGIYKKLMNTDPVVGWLVCTKGAEKGKDYRIYGKNNTIGRDERSDICIKGDKAISRENHAKLAYDRKHNNFHIIPADGAEVVYLNDEPVYVPTVLKAYDLLEIGESQFLFVPFCCDKFKWETPEEKDNK